VVELFLTRDAAQAQVLAEKLDALNTARRDSEARALEVIDGELLALQDAGGNYPAECILLDHPDWHRGVLGILASRVVDRTSRPALVMTHADGDAHGSGRSVPGFHLLDAITAAHTQDAAPLFHRFGGHAHAVGFSLPSQRLPLLRERIRLYAAAQLHPDLLVPQIAYDAEIGFDDLTADFADWLARCAPFGMDNPEPVFLTRNATLCSAVRRIQEKHVALQLGPLGALGAMPAIPALGWSRGAVDWAACTAGMAQGTVVDILYRIRRNTGPYASPHRGGLELELRALQPAAG
jgi:single-stranded-DNA-specific exonuclease